MGQGAETRPANGRQLLFGQRAHGQGPAPIGVEPRSAQDIALGRKIIRQEAAPLSAVVDQMMLVTASLAQGNAFWQKPLAEVCQQLTAIAQHYQLDGLFSWYADSCDSWADADPRVVYITPGREQAIQLVNLADESLIVESLLGLN